MDRQAQKAIMFGLHYGMNAQSSYMRSYIEEFARMAASMAVARNTGIGYICLEQPDYSGLELRLLHQFHDEEQWTVAPCVEPEPFYNRQYTQNQRGRHWDKQRKQEVKLKPKTAQEMLDEDFANDDTLYNNVFVFKVKPDPVGFRKTIACQVVEKGGKLQPMSYRWWMDTNLGIDFI